MYRNQTVHSNISMTDNSSINQFVLKWFTDSSESVSFYTVFFIVIYMIIGIFATILLHNTIAIILLNNNIISKMYCVIDGKNDKCMCLIFVFVEGK